MTTVWRSLTHRIGASFLNLMKNIIGRAIFNVFIPIKKMFFILNNSLRINDIIIYLLKNTSFQRKIS